MAREIEYFVVFDANVLVRDFWMEGPGFGYLRLHQFLGHKPIVPEVAFQEAQEHLRRRATELLAKTDASPERASQRRAQLERLFNYTGPSEARKWNVESLIRRWARHVRSVLSSSNGRIIETPRVELDDIIMRSIKRHKPFSKGDKGFRDTLIWLTVRDLVDDRSRVSFITDNANDFYSLGTEEPHAELVAELEARKPPYLNTLFHRSVDDFIACFDADRQASGDALKRALITGTFHGFDLWEWLEDNALAVFGEHELDMIPWAGVPEDAEALVLEEIEQLVSVDVSRVRHLSENVYRTYCDVSFVGIFLCCVLGEPVDFVISPKQVAWKNESREPWTDLGLRVAATFIMFVDIGASSDVRGS